MSLLGSWSETEGTIAVTVWQFSIWSAVLVGVLCSVLGSKHEILALLTLAHEVAPYQS